MTAATMTSKGQMTIPKSIRDKLKLKPGDRIDFVENSDGRVLLMPRNRDVRELRGFFPKPAKPVSDKQIKDAIERGWAGEVDV